MAFQHFISRAELNGLGGVVESYDAVGKRYAAKVAFVGERVRVQARNLVNMSEAALLTSMFTER